jgi:hypothetical protein
MLPKAVDGPRVIRASRRVGIPKLRKEELATGVDEVTRIRNSSGIMAAQRHQTRT